MDLVKNATREVVLPVDKMERMDTGLVLFTNDPELADRMAHGTKIRQLYHVTLRQPVKHEHSPRWSRASKPTTASSSVFR